MNAPIEQVGAHAAPYLVEVKEEVHAEEVRSDTGQPDEKGKVQEASAEVSGKNL